MSFSLAQGWIRNPAGDRSDGSNDMTPEAVQVEVEGMRKVVELYKTLSEQTPSDSFARRIQDVIQGESGAIFMHRKA